MAWMLTARPSSNVDLREYLSEEVQAVHTNTTYDLIANIVHDGKPSEGSYRIHVLHHVSGPPGGAAGGGTHTHTQKGAPRRHRCPLVSPRRAPGSGTSCRTCRSPTSCRR